MCGVRTDAQRALWRVDELLAEAADVLARCVASCVVRLAAVVDYSVCDNNTLKSVSGRGSAPWRPWFLVEFV